MAVAVAAVVPVAVSFIREVPLRTPSATEARTQAMAANPTSTVAQRAEALRSLEQEIGVLHRRIRRVIGERARMIDPDLNATGYYLLVTLATVGPSRASALAELFELDKGAVSRLVHQLQSLGLVERRPDPEDGRASILEATELALRRLDEVSAQRRRELAERLADWEPGELDQLLRSLGRYNAALADLDDEA